MLNAAFRHISRDAALISHGCFGSGVKGFSNIDRSEYQAEKAGVKYVLYEVRQANTGRYGGMFILRDDSPGCSGTDGQNATGRSGG